MQTLVGIDANGDRISSMSIWDQAEAQQQQRDEQGVRLPSDIKRYFVQGLFLHQMGHVQPILDQPDYFTVTAGVPNIAASDRSTATAAAAAAAARDAARGDLHTRAEFEGMRANMRPENWPKDSVDGRHIVHRTGNWCGCPAHVHHGCLRTLCSKWCSCYC